MFLGLVVVVVAVGLVFTYFQRKRGVVTVPGVSQTLVEPTQTINTKTAEMTYTVKEGDNLWKIAMANYGSGYNWVDISKANKLTSPGQLAVGQKLILPKAETKVTVNNEVKPTTKIEAGNYKVLRGDSLWKIAVRNYGDGFAWVKIWQQNKTKIMNPDKLEIGMELILPKLQ